MSLGPVVRWVGRSGKRVAITLVGFGLLAAGVVMMVTPGPGLLTIIAGLAVLGTEYAWAREALARAKRKAQEAADKVRRRRSPPGGPAPQDEGA